MPKKDDYKVCSRRSCEQPLVQTPGGGRPRLYCSVACRDGARRDRITERLNDLGSRYLAALRAQAGITPED